MFGRRRRGKGSPEKAAGSGSGALGPRRRGLLEVMGGARTVEGEEGGLGLGLPGNDVVLVVVRGERWEGFGGL